MAMMVDTLFAVVTKLFVLSTAREGSCFLPERGLQFTKTVLELGEGNPL